ncbi:16S pseudouridylate synthetase [Streptococcus pseudoporcinus]|uniref:Pseudouridine synthase n=1 Tax=Streptococcus pseudoporcinus TaxID=361101 RepID=A0A4U9YWQ0_9STRE|nr:pseudouridine synthase [Streptococcus pseudoporcinus]VTS31588.1 16S pseudouridylate synthetase [Streptococcus pseudoporcinus]
MRLDKLLETCQIGSRGQVKKLINAKRITIDDKVAIDGRQNVDPGLQTIVVDGNVLQAKGHHYFILNKSRGVVSALKDKEHPTVIDCLIEADRFPNLYPVGRLDRDTEGLVLLTDNGPLGFRMLHPNHHVDKSYYVVVNGFLDDDLPSFFRAGVVFLDGTVCKAAAVEILSAGEKQSVAKVTLSEGKFHQIKKMFLAYGVKVIYLKRMTFAEFTLGILAEGEYRTLTDQEKTIVKQYLD